MTQETFQKAFTEYFKNKHGITNIDELTERQAIHLRYALSTNDRSRTLIKNIEQECSPQWRQTLLLDVGCAYGGTCIEAAKLGARCWGIDIEETYIGLARTNADGLDLDVHFEVLDVTDRRVRKILPSGSFNLIVISDVFEHVYDTAGMLANLSNLMAPEGYLVFAIPNGNCMDYIKKEGHTTAFGLTLLNPFCWHLHPNPSTNIYYRRWEYYLAMLRHFGFEPRANPGAGARIPDPKKRIQNDLATIRKQIPEYSPPGMDPKYPLILQHEFDKFEREVRADLESLGPDELKWKYLTQFWNGVARYQAPAAPPPAAPGLTDLARGALGKIVDRIKSRR